MQLVELQGIVNALDEHGYALFAVSYDPVDALAAFSERNHISYSLLSDEGSHVITRLGLLDRDLDTHHAEFGGAVRDEQRGVCYPGVFVLNANGVVTERRFQRNYRVRESGQSLLERALRIGTPDASAHQEAEEDRVTVRAWLDSPTIWRYQRVHAIVQIEIAEPYHVIAADSASGYAPLTLDIQAENAEIGEPQWPEPAPFRIQGLDETVAVYTGTVRVIVPLEFIFQRGEEAGSRTLAVRVGFQTCSHTTCYPPATVRLELTATERPGIE